MGTQISTWPPDPCNIEVVEVEHRTGKSSRARLQRANRIRRLLQVNGQQRRQQEWQGESKEEGDERGDLEFPRVSIPHCSHRQAVGNEYQPLVLLSLRFVRLVTDVAQGIPWLSPRTHQQEQTQQETLLLLFHEGMHEKGVATSSKSPASLSPSNARLWL